jgi:hypothetical protein
MGERAGKLQSGSSYKRFLKRFVKIQKTQICEPLFLLRTKF